MALPIFQARRDARLKARIVAERELIYDEGAGPPGGAPREVRAGSGLAWSGDRLILIQDNADYVALIDDAAVGGSVVSLPLRQTSASGRSSRDADPGGGLQLEAALAAKDWRGDFVLAFGSGGDDLRRSIARMRFGGGDTEISVFRASKLYAQIAEVPGLCTQPLDVAGVALLPKGPGGVGGREGVRLFHRARCAPLSPGEEPPHLSGTVDLRLDALLAYLDRSKRDPNAFPGIDLVNPRRYQLNDLDGVPFGFTDAAAGPEGKVIYTAVAERDGEAVGLSVGVIEPDGAARYTIVVAKDGSYTRAKAGGLALRSDGSAYLVLDAGEGRAARLATVELGGV